MATAKTAPTPPTPPAQPEALPQSGGSYIRQPDGSLTPAQPAEPATPTTDPQE
jgi:hypothetical protein